MSNSAQNEPEGGHETGGAAARAALPIGVLAFVAVTALGFGAAVLPGAHLRVADLRWSLTLLALATLAVALPATRARLGATVVAPLAYIGSVVALVGAEGGMTRGSTVLLLVPIVWVALSGRPWESALVVAALIAAVTAMSIAADASLTVTLRRALLWAAVAGGISAAAHQLRRQLGRVIHERSELARQATSLEAAAEVLSGLRRPAEVFAAAARLAAEMTSPSSEEGRRANYLRIEDGRVRIAAQYDESGLEVGATFSLADHPPLHRLAETATALRASFADEPLAPDLQRSIEELGLTHGAWVPVAPDGTLHGALGVAGRRRAVPDELFHQLIALGHVVELALANALAHEELAEQATTDELTGLANRRGYAQLLARRGRRPFAIVVGDVDGLKAVNDRHGHAVGDALLARIGLAIHDVLRRGDVGARIGGDEFAILVEDANAATASHVARRLLDAVGEARIGEIAPRISLGVAVGAPSDDPEVVQREADNAMYRAKRRGGMTYVEAATAVELER